MNHQNSDFVYLPFDGDQRLMSRWKIYCVEDAIIFRFNNGSIVYVKTNQMDEE